MVTGEFGFDTMLGLAFTAGIDLDRAEDASIVSAFAPFGLISLLRTTDGSNPVPDDGVLTQDLSFRLDFGFLRANVTVDADDTTGNTSVADLAAHLNDLIDDAITAAIQELDDPEAFGPGLKST